MVFQTKRSNSSVELVLRRRNETIKIQSSICAVTGWSECYLEVSCFGIFLLFLLFG